MRNKVFVFLILANFCSVWASDVKVKLNSADGSTGFQVADSAGVVVSSITSAGDAVFATVTTTHTITAGSDIRVKGNDIHFGESQTDRKIYDDPATYSTRFSSNVYIESGALRDRTVESGDLNVISTWTLATANITTAVNTWSDMSAMYGTLNITAAPAIIFLYFNCTAFRTIADNGYPKVAVRFSVDGTAVGYAEFAAESDGFTGKCPLGLNAAYRVTTTGNKVVKVEWRSGDDGVAYGNANAYDRSFSAYWLGAP